MLFACYGFGSGVTDYSVFVVGWRVDCVQSEVGAFRGIDDIMSGTCWDDDSAQKPIQTSLLED